MASPSMRVPSFVKRQIELLAEQSDTTPQVVLARAVEAYTHAFRLERAQESAAALRQSDRWERLQAERESFLESAATHEEHATALAQDY